MYIIPNFVSFVVTLKNSILAQDHIATAVTLTDWPLEPLNESTLKRLELLERRVAPGTP